MKMHSNIKLSFNFKIVIKIYKAHDNFGHGCTKLKLTCELSIQNGYGGRREINDTNYFPLAVLVCPLNPNRIHVSIFRTQYKYNVRIIIYCE